MDVSIEVAPDCDCQGLNPMRWTLTFVFRAGDLVSTFRVERPWDISLTDWRDLAAGRRPLNFIDTEGAWSLVAFRGNFEVAAAEAHEDDVYVWPNGTAGAEMHFLSGITNLTMPADAEATHRTRAPFEVVAPKPSLALDDAVRRGFPFKAEVPAEANSGEQCDDDS